MELYLDYHMWLPAVRRYRHAVAQLVEALCYKLEGPSSIPVRVIGVFH